MNELLAANAYFQFDSTREEKKFDRRKTAYRGNNTQFIKLVHIIIIYN